MIAENFENIFRNRSQTRKRAAQASMAAPGWNLIRGTPSTFQTMLDSLKQCSSGDRILPRFILQSS